jgi:SAM-dependent methyltransferase
MTDAARREFFASGQEHADHVLDMVRQHVDPKFKPRSILDFGCGVGRVLIPFAKVASHVVGLDVAPSMLAEARKNCQAHGCPAVRLLISDDELSGLKGTFDLIHSYIVFQHVPPERGRAIFAALLRHLAPRGVGALHFSYSKSHYAETHGLPPPPPKKRRLPRLMPEPKPVPSPDPEMQMFPYPMNEVLFVLQAAGMRLVQTEFTDHGGELGAFLYFQRPAAP